MVACSHNQTATVRDLIAAGARVELKGQHGFSCAHASAMSGAIDALRIVTAAAPSLVSDPNPENYTPLHLAAQVSVTCLWW